MTPVVTVSTRVILPPGAQKKPPVRTLRVRTGDFRVGLLVSRLTLRRVIRPTRHKKSTWRANQFNMGKIILFRPYRGIE